MFLNLENKYIELYYTADSNQPNKTSYYIGARECVFK